MNHSAQLLKELKETQVTWKFTKSQKKKEREESIILTDKIHRNFNFS